MTSPAEQVRSQQQDWARRRNISTDSDGYTELLESNFLVPLSDETIAEFSAGDGGELGKSGQRGKIQALHSSSALACNVFEYWRGRNASALANALGIGEDIESITFECKFPTGLPGSSPNLDVVLTSASGFVTAIECKFLEPYRSHGSGFKSKYFQSEIGLWKSAGFPACQLLAEQLYSGEIKYRWLHAEQLLKHVLGLQKGLHKRWAFMYLWYEVSGVAAKEHASESDAFAAVALSDGIHFRTLSYQSLFRALKVSATASDCRYVEYLEDRYFEPLPTDR